MKFLSDVYESRISIRLFFCELILIVIVYLVSVWMLRKAEKITEYHEILILLTCVVLKVQNFWFTRDLSLC